MAQDSLNLTTPAATSGSVSAKKRGRPPNPLTPKACTICGAEFMPLNRYQQARNRTCSPECSRTSMSATKKGRPSPLNQRVLVACTHCGELVSKSPSRVSRVEKTYCSRSCRSKANAHVLLPYAGNMKGRKREGDSRYGEANPAWKGGVTYKRAKGNYIGPRYVRCPEEWLMMARKDGYIMEHRLVMAQWVGRPLLRTEVVNHINRNPRDNRRENLEMYPSNGDHKRGEVGRFVPGVTNRYAPKA